MLSHCVSKHLGPSCAQAAPHVALSCCCMYVCVACVCTHVLAHTVAGGPTLLLLVLHVVLLTTLCLTLSWSVLRPQL
jgi:hypothetical protein